MPSTTNLKNEDEIPHPRSHSISGIQGNESPSHQVKLDQKSYMSSSNPIDMQLKYENDRLKLALAQR